MAVVREIIDQDGWQDWVATRPVVIQELCKKLPPDRLYLLKTSGHCVTIYSYSEDNTVTVDVSGEYNWVAFERRVFGISPENLEECDLPGDDELLGTGLTEENDIGQFIELLRNEATEDTREVTENTMLDFWKLLWDDSYPLKGD